jgi:hypothetical protein
VVSLRTLLERSDRRRKGGCWGKEGVELMYDGIYSFLRKIKSGLARRKAKKGVFFSDVF